MTIQTAPVETIEVEGDRLLTKVKGVVREGNGRRIRILYEDEELIDVSTDRGRRRRAPSVGRHRRKRPQS